jgi:hypothetical protein
MWDWLRKRKDKKLGVRLGEMLSLGESSLEV